MPKCCPLNSAPFVLGNVTGFEAITFTATTTQAARGEVHASALLRRPDGGCGAAEVNGRVVADSVLSEVDGPFNGKVGSLVRLCILGGWGWGGGQHRRTGSLRLASDQRSKC